MSTRSLIGIVKDDGSCETIYCHWDGYPDYNGKILLESYLDMHKIEELLNLGDISLLNESISPSENSDHSFDTPKAGIVIAYHRDRGESYHPPHTWGSKNEVAKLAFNCSNAEYVYLFENNEWIYCETLGKNKYRYLPLKEYKFTE